MARPISWLPRLHDIRRSVANSSRSHYTRPDLETLFGVKDRAAQKLIELLPSTSVGTSRLVEREALAGFLERVHAADQPALVLEEQRSAAPKTSRRQLRHLVRNDGPRASIASLPRGLHLEAGRLEVRFSTVEEMAGVLFGVAQILEDEMDEFARRFEPKVEKPVSEEALELRRMFARLGSSEALGIQRQRTTTNDPLQLEGADGNGGPPRRSGICPGASLYSRNPCRTTSMRSKT